MSDKIEPMAAHIVSEVQYDMRHGKPVSSSCDYVERRLREVVADARRAERVEAIETVAKMLDEFVVEAEGRKSKYPDIISTEINTAKWFARRIRDLVTTEDDSSSNRKDKP